MPAARVALCADVGSTFTKVAAVDLDRATVIATAQRPTTSDSDVLRGLDEAIGQISVALPAGATVGRPYVCSSAGGGLRLAVVGYEALVTAEAGFRVGLCAGARVVHVSAGPLDRAGVDALRDCRPDVILLVGGTDGGDTDVLTHNARRLAAARVATHRRRVPVVVAGNIDARADAVALLLERGTPAQATGNVLPRIGVLDPAPARAAIRDTFLRHVIGGKHLSRGSRFASLVRAATPDVVLAAVELLGDLIDTDVVVVDIGGATTDVYSVVRPDPHNPPVTDVAGALRASRTVEGDLGMRISAGGVVEAARVERLVADAHLAALTAAAAVRVADPGLLGGDETDPAVDARLAALAATVAVRRHARGDHAPARISGAHHPTSPTVAGAGAAAGRDLSRVGLVIGSGGVLRHTASGTSKAVLDAVLDDHVGGWSVPRAARVRVDTAYVLAPAGLLVGDHPDVAGHLLRESLLI